MYKRSSYPKLEINLSKLKHNIEQVTKKCGEQGIAVAGVIKGCTGLFPCVQQFEAAGVSFIASSRLEQLAELKEKGIKTPLLMIRIPLLSEVYDLVRYCDASLNSEIEVLKALNEAALSQGKIHEVILMADCGDLREGFWDKEEMAQAALMVENEMDGLKLIGTGFNIGCYGSIMATPEKLQELVDVTEMIEDRIGRKLEFISGGASTSYFRVLEGNMPERINMLRIGEVLLLPDFMYGEFGFDSSDLYSDVFTLKAEVIEVKDKPTHPVGDIGFDAFGHRIEYVDRGIRKRALLGLGKCDFGDYNELILNNSDMEVIGASSDHTIVDVQDAFDKGIEVKVGDVLSFSLNYATIVYVSNSRNITVEYV
ncbi:MAG: alanine racemase [Firmicutes bacterium]|nr:alanine racemase [Bacillota bacterium]